MKILFQGDSHITYFKYAANHNMLPNQHNYVTQQVNAATAQGLTNPNSKTNALVEFRQKLNVEKPDCILTHLGEVDCGFVIWYWAEKGIRTIEEQVTLSINNYITYLKEAKELVKYIIVTSPTLPTIKDDAYSDKYNTVANLRKEIKATQTERTKLTLQYDELLKERCAVEGFIYIQCTSDLLNTEGQISDKYLHINKHNHHLNNAMISPIWAKKLFDILNALS